jgi:histidine triad (HIT) family protein
MSESADCIFCKIIAKEVSTKQVVYEDEMILGFLDIFPTQKGHTLLVPKRHSKDFLTADEDMLQALARAAKIVAPAVLRSVDADGFNVVLNTGAAAGQAIFHLHWHIIPRFHNDSVFQVKNSASTDDEMAVIGQRIREIITPS